MNLSRHSKALLAAFGVYFIWGFTFYASSVAQQTASPLILLMYRFLLSSVLMLIPVALGRKKLRVKKEDFIILLAMSLFEPGIYFIGEQYGIKYTNSSFAGIFISLIPLLDMVLADIFFKEKPVALQWIFCVVSILGVIAVTLLTSSAGGHITVKGVFWLLVAVTSAGAYATCNKALANRGIHPYTRTVFPLIVGAMFFAVGAIFESRKDLSQLIVPLRSLSFDLAVIYVAVFASVAGYSLYNYAIDNAPIANVVSLNSIVTVISVIAGVVFLHEPFSFGAAIAMLVVIVGVWGVQKFTPESVKK